MPKSDVLLSILIASIPQRAYALLRLLKHLKSQVDWAEKVEILVDKSVGPTTGAKRNMLLHRATGKYVCFIDDDDLVSDDYVSKVLAACGEDKDCASITGWAVFDKRSKLFQNTLQSPGWGEDAEKFYRTPNHLNAVKHELALSAGFPDVSVGEDHEYSRRLQPLLRTEAEVPGVVYHYFCEPLVRARVLGGPGGLRFLLKWPTRGRAALFAETLKEHRRTLSSNHMVDLVVSLDEDDPQADAVRETLKTHMGSSTKTGPAGRTKVQVINADIPTDPWDVLVLLADDMVPVEQDWDERIVLDMMRNFPHLDGVLAYDDGYRPPPRELEEVSCITMPVMGRKFFDRRGHIYHPEYTSLHCDVELADVAVAAGKAKRIPRVIVKHDWIGQRPDDLLHRNESYYAADENIYKRRKAAGFPRGSSLVYSQNDEEDAILREVGGPAGRLLDIGAYDGKTLSNTLRLIELGWEAVLVEPAHGPFGALVKQHGDNDQVQLVNAAVAGKPGFAVFSDSRGDAVSTLSEAHRDLWSSQVKAWDRYLVRAVSPNELLAMIGHRFDFISIDVEGTNLSVFKAFPWTLIEGLRLVCVEHEGNEDEMAEILKPMGFERFYLNAENCMFRRTL